MLRRLLPAAAALHLAALLAALLAACGHASRPAAVAATGRIIPVSDTIDGTENADTLRFGRLGSGEIAVMRFVLHNVARRPLRIVSYARAAASRSTMTISRLCPTRNDPSRSRSTPGANGAGSSSSWRSGSTGFPVRQGFSPRRKYTDDPKVTESNGRRFPPCAPVPHPSRATTRPGAGALRLAERRAGRRAAQGVLEFPE